MLRYTSKECCRCGHTAKANRVIQSIFACKKCEYRLNGDLNAAKVIRSRSKTLIGLQDAMFFKEERKCHLERADVNQPIVEGSSGPIYKPTTLVVGN